MTDALFEKILDFILPKDNDEESSDSLVQQENSFENVNSVSSVISLKSGLSPNRARREFERPLHLQDYILMAEFSNPDSYASATAASDAELKVSYE